MCIFIYLLYWNMFAVHSDYISYRNWYIHIKNTFYKEKSFLTNSWWLKVKDWASPLVWSLGKITNDVNSEMQIWTSGLILLILFHSLFFPSALLRLLVPSTFVKLKSISFSIIYQLFCTLFFEFFTWQKPHDIWTVCLNYFN